MTTDRRNANIQHLSDRALYRRSEEMLFEAARLHCSGRRSGLRKRVRRYLKPYRRDRSFLSSLLSSVGRALVVAYLLAQLWATEVNAQPSFSSSSPANATHATAVGANISTTFSEAIAAGTVSSATFILHGGFIGKHLTGGTASTHKDATYTGGGTTTLTIDPGANFAPGELLSVTLTTGLQNGSAQALTAAKVIEFRAAATGGPAVFSNASHNVDTLTNKTMPVALGDLDGDGDLDLLTGEYTQANRVYLANGNGTFAPGSDVDTPTNSTRSVKLGDLDGDGDLDLVTGNSPNQVNRVYLGNGNGTFATGNNVDTPANSTWHVSLGDLDGDGDLDLITGNNGGGVVNRVYLGNGNGTFATGNNVDPAANNTTAVLLGDVDGDGDLDLVTANEGAQANRVYLNNGNGTFATGNNVDTPANNTRSGSLGDLDGDGDLDFVAGNTAQVNRVYLGNGNGTFASGSNVDTPTNTTRSVPLADVDGDGDLDLLVANSGQANRKYLNNGNGTFASGSDVATPTNSSQAVAIGDVDGDGDLDLVAGNYTQVNRVYLNSNTKFSSSSPAVNANNGATTSNVSPTFTQTMNAATSSTFVVRGDMTGKRSGTYSGASSATLTFDPTNDFRPGELVEVTLKTDLKSTSGDAMQPPRVYRFLGAATGGPAVFTNASHDVHTPTNSTLSLPLGDLNGDGDLDLVAGNSTQVNRVYLGNGNGTFASGNNVDTPTNNTYSALLGDLDADGDLDLVTSNGNQVNRVYLGNGNGTFATGNNIATPTNDTRSMSLGDLDGDGDLDVVTGNNTQVNRVYLGNGNGTFATGTNVATPTNNTQEIRLADLDGDGDLDLVTGNSSQVNRVYLGNGNGTFAAGNNVATPTDQTFSVPLADVDGDGDLDLVTGNSGAVNRLYLGNGNGTFASGTNVETPTNQTRFVSLGDLDGDGDLDIATGNLGEVNRVYLNSNTKFSSSSPTVNANNAATTSNVSPTFTQSMQAATSSTFVVHGGLTGKRAGTYSGASSTTLSFDPTKDIAPGEVVNVTLTAGLKSTSGDAMQPPRVYQFRGAATGGPAVFSNASHDVAAPTNTTLAVSLGDMDGDGDLDLVTGNVSQANRAYLSNGNGSFASGADVATPTHQTRAVPLGDVDGDGDLDLVTGNYGQVNRVYLNSGNGDVVSSSDVATPTHQTQSVSLGDVDGDGDLDLVMGNRNVVNRVYLGSGSNSFSSGTDVDTPTDNTASVSLGDLDGDGDLDLVTGNLGVVNRVYLGKGNGTFASGNSVDTPTHQTRYVSLGDLDADGDLDLVTGNNGQANRRYLGNGNGTFASGSDVATPANGTLSIALGDFDGDGDLDLAAGNSGVNRVYLGAGNGTFASGSDVDTPANTSRGIALGDLDGDRDLDIVAGNDNTVNRLYLNNNTSFSSSSPTANNKNVANGSNVSATFNKTMNAATTSTFTVHGNMSGKKAGGYSGGNSSTLTFNPTGNFKPNELVEVSLKTGLKGNAGDALQPSRVYQLRAAASKAPAVFSNVSHDVETGTTNATRPTSLGDLDGDGDIDLITGDYNQVNRVYLNTGSGAFAASSNVETGTTNKTWSTSLGDLDGDGDLDLITGNVNQINRVYLGNGSGAFASGSNVETGTTNDTYSVPLGDLDGDGDIDLVTANYNQVNRVYLGNGSGAFAAGSDVETGTTNKTQFASLGDLDGDGDLDLITGNVNQVNRLYLNTGSGTFAAGSDVETGATNNTQSTSLGDLDGDGDLDLIVGSDTQVNRVHLNTGSGTFAAGSDVETGTTNNTKTTSLGDLDGDGDLDLITGNRGQVNRAYLNTGSGAFAAGSNVDAATNETRSTLLGDLDGDGDLDLIAGNYNQVNRVYLNSGKLTSSGLRLAENGTAVLAANLLSLADASKTTSQIVYSIQIAPTRGSLTKSGATIGAGSTFTQDDIDNSRISYAHAGAEFFRDSFVFTVAGYTGSNFFAFDIDQVNDAPALDVLREVQVDEGGSVVVSNGYLRVLDSDNHASELIFSVAAGPFHGRIGRSTFTQTDIDESLVRYIHDGSETTRDSLLFSVADGNGSQLISTWLRFAVKALNEAPIIPSIETPNVSEGHLLVLDLAATDPEGAAIQTTVTGLPAGATLDGTMLKWLPRYDQAGTYPLAAVYDDGQGGSSRLRIDINVSDAPVPVLMPDPALVDFGDVAAGEVADRTFALVNQSPIALELAPFSSTLANLSVTNPAFPLGLEPGERVDITTRFTATTDRADLQQAQLTSATELGPVEVPAVGRSIWRRLVADNEEVRFLPAVIGDIRWKHLNLSNPGNLPLDVLAQLADDTAFGVEPATITLPGGEKRIMRIRFVPVTTAAVEALLTLTSEQGTLDIPLRGQGREPEEGRVTIDFNLQNGNQQESRIGDAIAGSVFVLQLHAKGAPTVSGWSVRVDYNPDDVSYVIGSFAPGSFLSRLVPLESVGGSYVEVGGDALGRESPEMGSGILGTLSFQVEDGFSGETELAVSRVAWRREGWVGPDRALVYAPAEITAGPVIFSLAGDFDEDGTVDVDDFLLFAEQFDRRVPPAEPRFDLDDDGRIGAVDFFLFADLVIQEE